MCHVIRDLGLAKFQLPLMSNYKSLCYDPPPPHSILAFSGQFNQRSYKTSINPCTIFVSLVVSHYSFSFIQAKMSFTPIQPLGSPGEDTHLNIGPS